MVREPRSPQGEVSQTAAAQVDAFIEVLSKRYGLEANEIVESLVWLREHRQFMDKLQHGGLMAIVALLITALAAAIWEGVLSIVRGVR